jgi:hypothetical protein
MEKLLAANPLPLGGTIGSGAGLGPLSAPTSGTNALTMITRLVSSVIGFMTVAAGIWFIFQFLIGGYTWLSSMGDKHRLQEARDRIVNALIGLVIVVAGVAIVSLAGQFFGWDLLITRPEDIITGLNL